MRDIVSTAGLALLLLASCSISSLDGFSGGGAGDTPDAGPTADADSGGDAGGPSACSPDLVTDPRHCGRCGHDCLGGQCADGMCQPIVVASEEGQPIHVAIDDAWVYWTRHTNPAVRIAPLAGGAPTTLFTPPPGERVTSLGIDATEVCWTTPSSMHCAPRGLPGALTSRTLASDVPGFYFNNGDGSSSWGPTTGLASDGVDVYAAGFDGATNWDGLAVVPKTGLAPKTKPTVVSRSAHGTRGVAVDAANVYFGFRPPPDHQAAVYKLPKGASTNAGAPPAVVLAENQADPLVLAVADGTVYWSNYVSGALMSVPAAGGPIGVLGEALGGPVGVAVDEKYVYVANSSDGKIVACARTGCGSKPIELAKDQAGPTFVATNGSWVVWTSSSNGTVMRVRTP